MGYLKYIELENFKSYKGNVKIGPFKSFTAIIGTNGSGKSNLMDAISFVLGEPTKNLRVKKLNDLIHGAPIGKPIATRASVSFIYSCADNPNDDKQDINDQTIANKETKFTRTILGSSSEYRLDGRVVNTQEYQLELEKIGIFLKAKNFLVYQGQVESIAMKNPKEISQVFEEISRSIELKEDYERLKIEMEKAEEETQVNFQKKRGVAAQKKEAKLEKDEKERYEKLKKQVHDLEIQYRLFQLYFNETAMDETSKELNKLQYELKNLECNRNDIEDEIKEKKKEQSVQTRQMTKIEEKIKDAEGRLTKRRPQFIKAKENSTHMFKKLDSSKVSYEAALKAHHMHKTDIEQLEAILRELEEKRAEFERDIERDALSQGINLELRASQLKTYQKLKEQVAKQNAKIKEQLDGLSREHKVDQDALENEQRKKNDSNSKLKQKLFELEDQKVKLMKLNEYIDGTEKQIEEQRDAETRLSREIDNSKALCKQLEDELGKIQQEIGDARLDRGEQMRNSKKAEVIDQLKKKYSGVYGRLMDHCEPIHRKYQVAITKVMGKSMDSIVVDTEKTARECIQFMKENHLPPETFLPLDTIDAPTLDERLREIKEPRNTKLLFDVIKYQPAQIKKVLLYSVGNCLVCETDDDARQLAFNETARHKVVSFDGTLFQKSGLISGGSSELKQKAKRWDEKHFDGLRRRKDQCTEQYKEQVKISRKEPELADIRSNIKGLEHRLKYSRQNKDSAEQRTIVALEKDIASLKEEMNLFEPTIKDVEKRMNNRQREINKLKQDGYKIEDEIFADFCTDIGITNIRVYEERELAGQQERLKERMRFDEQKTALVSQLEFEKSRDTLKSFQRWQKEMQEHEKDLQKFKEDEQKLLDEINKIEEDIGVLKVEAEQVKLTSGKFDEELNEIKKRLSTHNKELSDLRKRVSSEETKSLDKKSERHRILKQCKLDSIELPMLVGSMDDISEEDQALAQSNSSTESLVSAVTQDACILYEREAKIKIDYRKLSRELGNLTSQEAVDRREAELFKELNDLKETLKNFQMPNFRVDEKLDNVREMWENTSSEFEKARQAAKTARNNFNRVKDERLDRYTKCFEHISSKIDQIYKSLCMNQGAQASLMLENAEEPYLDGVTYNCVAPGKRFRQMDNLSGGEKTVAALALLFAIRSYNPSPFFVLDEVDAALDNTNISKVANYIIEQSSKGLQCIVISLKEEFFHYSDALIGVYPEANDCIASKILSLDLTSFNESNADNTRE